MKASNGEETNQCLPSDNHEFSIKTIDPHEIALTRQSHFDESMRFIFGLRKQCRLMRNGTASNGLCCCLLLMVQVAVGQMGTPPNDDTLFFDGIESNGCEQQPSEKVKKIKKRC